MCGIQEEKGSEIALLPRTGKETEGRNRRCLPGVGVGGGAGVGKKEEGREAKQTAW